MPNITAGRPRRRKLRTGVPKRRLYKQMRIRRSLYPKANEPTFVETYRLANTAPNYAQFGDFQITAGGGIGRQFAVSILDIPQMAADYANLYRQYRINWVKVIVVPDFNTLSTEENASQYNSTLPTNYYGMARVVHSIDDTPGVPVPASEADVLENNGAKIKALKHKWSVSFKPVPSVSQEVSGINTIYTRQKFRQWFNFDTVTTGNNPIHGYVSSYWSLPGGGGGKLNCSVYYKVSFTLRDPQ